MTLRVEDYIGWPSGMNTAKPQHQLDDTEAYIIQDAYLDHPDHTRRRGPLKKIFGMGRPTYNASGFAVALDPLGTPKYALFNGDTSHGYFSIYSSDRTSLTDIAWGSNFPSSPPTNPYRIIDAKAALGGGTMLGTSSAYDANSPVQTLGYWRGGTNANGTKVITVARGSTAVSAASGFSTTLSPGMWIFSNTDEPYTGTLIGCVRTVNSDTSVTLVDPSPYAVTGKTATFQAFRGVFPVVTTGLITCSTSLTTVNGGGTKFKDQALDSGVWNIYRLSDKSFVGKVSSVQSNIGLTLAANAAQSLADAPYLAIKVTNSYPLALSATSPGFLNAVYADRQWLVNNGSKHETTASAWYSDLDNPEAIDMTSDGNRIDIHSTKVINEDVRAVTSTYNALVIHKETETFGIFGSSPDQFDVRKIWDDGVLSGMSVQPYGSGCVWAGVDGIHYFDGSQVSNLTAEKLGNVWRDTMRTFDPTTYRMYSMIGRETYYLFIENLTSSISLTRGSTTHYPSKWIMCFNMVTGAVTMVTNVHFRGAITTPSTTGRSTWFVVNDTTKGAVCDLASLYEEEDVDEFACDTGTIGPDFYVESKKFPMFSLLTLKRVRRLVLAYLAQGGGIILDIVSGLNREGTPLSTVYPATAITWYDLSLLYPSWTLTDTYDTWYDIAVSLFKVKRKRFNLRTQFFSFRLYQETANVKKLRVGPFQIGYKPMRTGRVI